MFINMFITYPESKYSYYAHFHICFACEKKFCLLFSIKQVLISLKEKVWATRHLFFDFETSLLLSLKIDVWSSLSLSVCWQGSCEFWFKKNDYWLCHLTWPVKKHQRHLSHVRRVKNWMCNIRKLETIRAKGKTSAYKTEQCDKLTARRVVNSYQ